MKHFTTEEWIDFMNQVTRDGQRTEMKEHLKGCERCASELQMWEKVRSVGTMEDSLQPPSEMVQWVKASYGPAVRIAPKTKGSLVEVLFDSFLQPAIAGARSTANGSRQMLYRAGSYQIDIQVELKPGTNLVVIAGQIMDIANAAAAGERIPVTLSNLHGHIIYTSTNRFGEFRGEIQNSGDLELSIPRPGEDAITISLRNALNQFPGETA